MKRFLSFALALVVLLSCVSLFACGNDVQEGTHSFTFVAVHGDGTEKSFEITTDKANVGDALLEENLIAGDDGDYGLYVKTVDGEYAEYTETGAYWSFYVGDEIAMTGVSSTEIEDGATYKMVYTKAE